MLISRNLAVAMVNCDYSGLLEHEIEAITHFPNFTVTDWKEWSSDINGKCSINGKKIKFIHSWSRSRGVSWKHTKRLSTINSLLPFMVSHEL